MSHRAYLFSLRMGHALRESCFQEPYTRMRFRKDLMAGLTVGVISIPLAMAFAIASGVPPQYGLYTSAIAGFFIALTGGSRFSVSGPTASVVILYPIVHNYGLSGLLMASMMAGMMLVLLAIFRLGRLIEYVPQPVTLGFTAGIGVVIATLQVKDFLGLPIETMPEHYLDKIRLLAESINHTHWPSLMVALLTLAIMLLWPRLNSTVPPHLPAVVLGSLAAFALTYAGIEVDTIYSRFSYTAADGTLAQGIPPLFPRFEWPWAQMGAANKAVGFSWRMVNNLLPAAFALAVLAAIESLLCAVVLDGMTGKRHSANSELLGQGIGNIIAPLFGGITATAALARSSVNFKVGAESPVAAMIHALVVMFGLVTFAPLLNYLSMPVMAALLMVVAWNMAEAHKSIHLLKASHSSDRWVFLCCFSLTILFDMVIAITTGIIVAAVLFIKEIADMTHFIEITNDKFSPHEVLPKKWRVFKITGPLFFTAADKIFAELTLYCEKDKGIILYLDGVSVLDAGGVSALNKLISHCAKVHAELILTDVQFQPLKALAKSHTLQVEGVFRLFPSLQNACQHINQSLPPVICFL